MLKYFKPVYRTLYCMTMSLGRYNFTFLEVCISQSGIYIYALLLHQTTHTIWFYLLASSAVPQLERWTSTQYIG